ncbi:hypothetical protein BGZ93_006767 [Podila epicladia]|nr:hypothetical protein BGZ92_006949 [Podila epicladia]KAG0094786.1 hypothetical protein BGZ93_006767 [Podila epicladia]
MLSSHSTFSSLSSTSSFPGDGDTPARMRIHISHAKNLASKDLNGFSDPYIKISVGGHKFTTTVVPKSLNPVWNASFDFDLEAQSIPNEVRFMVWDKDWVSKDDFMGCLIVPLDSASIWADAVPRHFDDPANKAMWHSLSSIPGKSSKVSGEVEIKFGFIDSSLAPSSRTSQIDCERVWDNLINSRNKLGLGQRQVVFSENSSVALTDIPMAGGEVDPTLGFGNLSLDSATPTKSSSSDLHGLVFMEVVSASNLPKLHNVTRTGFDMDPFVIVSFGKYIFRTRVIRHNLNPVWNGKLMFKVRKGEESFKIKYSVHDWDKMSGNDRLGMALINVNDFIKDAEAQEATPAGMAIDNDNDMALTDYQLKIEIDNKIKITTEDALLNIRAKFVSYAGLRRRFWLGLTNSYNVDNHKGTYNKVLIQTMLEELGSNLSRKTIDSFWTPYSKNPEHDELTFDQLFEQLEKQVRLDDSATGAHGDTSKSQEKKKSRMSWFKKSRTPSPTDSGAKESNDNNDDEHDRGHEEDSEQYNHVTRNVLPHDPDPQAVDIMEPEEADFDPHQSEHEHVIRISTCPICHDPNLGTMSESDVITHIAICSSRDGFNLDKLILGNFVTEANAQRKWITKVVKSLGYGRYVAGKSNANIIVQDRATGAMFEEKMPTFIRLGIRLLYKSPANKISVGKILADMSRKQGIKFDDPKSVRDIEPFIRFHNLQSQMSEVLEPLQNFKNFNEFFYRKLKADARILSAPGNDRVAVSVADCRMTCFQTISDAAKFWIKGRQFTIGKLLGDEAFAKKYDGGALAIFRLAPQDYHRYHIPVKGTLSEPKPINGEYYTVNPMAIRSQLDVYGENKRVVSTIESQEFGTVAFVAIGAMMVGSIVLTTQGGQNVERMDEHGYFAFGGSTIVILFEPHSIKFDEDLIQSSKEQIEMLVKVGMRIGESTR